ncbi:N/A [soil metagenome]
MDLGTGDGRAVLHVARRRPEALIIGVDTAAEAMRETSRRAARRPGAGGAPNALFLVGDATRLDGLEVLAGRVDEVRVSLPWGSLARAVLDAEPSFIDRLVVLLRPGGRVRLLMSLVDRDGGLGRPPLSEGQVRRLAADLAVDRLTIREVRAATSEDVSATGSSWAKRLGVPSRRPAWLVELERPDSPSGTARPPARV